MIIEIEGCDGVGKTTVAKALAERLKATYLKFPDRSTPSGQIIDTMLKTPAAHDPVTFQALNIVNRMEKMTELDLAHVSTTRHVVCDRYISSAYVYGIQDKVPEAWLRNLMDYFPGPSLHVLLMSKDIGVIEARLAGRKLEVYESKGKSGLISQQIQFLLRWAKDDPHWVIYDTGLADTTTIVDSIVSDFTYLLEVARG